jgi:cysteine desulfurase
LAERTFDDHAAHCRRLRDRLIAGLDALPGVRLNGPRPGASRWERLPNNVNMSFERISAENLLILLDGQDIAASSGSACSSGATDPSHVLLAVGQSRDLAHGSLRLTVGRANTEAEIDTVLAALPEAVERLRALAPPV